MTGYGSNCNIFLSMKYSFIPLNFRRIQTGYVARDSARKCSFIFNFVHGTKTVLFFAVATAQDRKAE
jgi:hypothetical protein